MHHPSHSIVILLSVGLLCWSTPSSATSVIDFEGLPAGTIVSSVASGSGVSGDSVAGSVQIFGDSMDPAITTNAAILFDAACSGGCSGRDDDLMQPAQGSVLIIAEDLEDQNGDGLVDDPDDADLDGASLSFDFSGWGVGMVAVERLTVLDVDADEPGGVIELFSGGPNGTLLAPPIPLPITGDGGVAVVPIGVFGVDYLRVTPIGSAAIDNIEIGAAPFCGDGVVDPDAGEECEPGDPSGCSNRMCRADCTCVPKIFNDPAKIVFGNSFRPDRYQGNGRVETEKDPAKYNEPITLRLVNPSGVLYAATLEPGDCVPSGSQRSCQFRDSGARRGEGIRGGISRMQLRAYKSGYRLRFQAYGDFSAAVDPDMTVQVQIGDELFATRGIWKRTRSGWRLKFGTLNSP